jgi:hypothetical protein
MDLQKKNFYTEALTHLEEIIALYDENFEGDDEELDEDEKDEKYYDEKDALETFINHIRDAQDIANEHS